MELSFSEFLGRMSKKEKARFAARVDANYEVLRQISKNTRKAGPLLAKKIEQESYGMVKKESIRPDVFGE